MYEVHLSAEALRVHQRAQAPLARKLSRCLAVLSETPQVHPNIKPLSAKYAGSWRYRVGDWRIVYRPLERRERTALARIRGEAVKAGTVLVERIVNRRDLERAVRTLA